MKENNSWKLLSSGHDRNNRAFSNTVTLLDCLVQEINSHCSSRQLNIQYVVLSSEAKEQVLKANIEVQFIRKSKSSLGMCVCTVELV